MYCDSYVFGFWDDPVAFYQTKKKTTIEWCLTGKVNAKLWAPCKVQLNMLIKMCEVNISYILFIYSYEFLRSIYIEICGNQKLAER